MELFQYAEIWMAFSFIAFFALVIRFGGSTILGKLDDRIKTIREEIETAENLRVESQELLAQYQRKHRDALKTSDEIIAGAEKQAQAIRAEAQKDLEESMERREKQLAERLDRMQKSALNEIQQYAANLATKATAEIIADKLDKKTATGLIDQAIKDLDANIH